MSGTRIETATLAVGPPGSAGGGASTATAASVPLTVAEPDGVARGGLVVLHEARGVEGVESVLAALAAEGWLSVAPHLYHRSGEPGGDDVAGQLASLTGADVLADCDAAFAWLAAHDVPADRIGVLGFDLGGAVAFVVAASREVGAAVSVSPTGVAHALSDGLPSLVDSAASLACPWLGLFGESDPDVPAAEVEALREAAAGALVATNVVTYPGVGHRFDVAPADDGVGAEGVTVDAGQRVLDWFDSHLR